MGRFVTACRVGGDLAGRSGGGGPKKRRRAEHLAAGPDAGFALRRKRLAREEGVHVSLQPAGA